MFSATVGLSSSHLANNSATASGACWVSFDGLKRCPGAVFCILGHSVRNLSLVAMGGGAVVAGGGVAMNGTYFVGNFVFCDPNASKCWIGGGALGVTDLGTGPLLFFPLGFSLPRLPHIHKIFLAAQVRNFFCSGNSAECQAGTERCFWGQGGCYYGDAKGTGIVVDCVMDDNRVDGVGGGGALFSGVVWALVCPSELILSAGAHNLTLRNCMVSANKAREGAGLWVTEKSLALVQNCSLVGNVANLIGGGLAMTGSVCSVPFPSSIRPAWPSFP